MKWLAESVRLTAFTSSAEMTRSPSWWESVVGTPPDETLTKSLPPLLQESGLMPGGSSRLLMEHTVGRIDWRLVPNIDPQELPTEFPSIGQLDESIHQFGELVAKWLPQSPPLNRLAMGAVAIFPVDSRIVGYQTLQPFLPAVKLDPEGSSDFAYTINRPRTSQTQGPKLTINRLSKWGVVRMGFMQFTTGQPAPTDWVEAEDIHACRVEFDINSAPLVVKDGTIAPERLQQLIDEFFMLSKELIAKGDIP